MQIFWGILEKSANKYRNVDRPNYRTHAEFCVLLSALTLLLDVPRLRFQRFPLRLVVLNDCEVSPNLPNR